MKRQRDELGIKEYPLFTHEEIDDTAHLYQGFKYNREIDWAAFHRTRAGIPSPSLEFHDAGHAIGSAGIIVRAQKETLFFTGDVCFQDQTILKAARFDGNRPSSDDLRDGTCDPPFSCGHQKPESPCRLIPVPRPDRRWQNRGRPRAR